MTDAIVVEALAKHYPACVALEHVSARVAMGSVVGLLGHNGAGKSTLIKLVLGLIRPSAGHIAVLGASPWGAGSAALRRRIGYLPENVAFYGNLTGREVLAYLAALKRAPRAQVDELLERVGLAAARDRRVAAYSKGMRQRLGVAQALLGNPEVVVLDEPTSGLDPQATRELYGVIAQLRAQGCGVLVSSHLLAELEPHIDSALILRRGELLAAGSMQDLRQRAGLPDLMQVRLRRDDDAAQFLRELHASGALYHVANDGRYEIEVAGSAKLALLQRLAARAEVGDIVVKEASLARLYDHLGAVARQGEGMR
ncbi:MAG: ABC transporter ATP-binding protein [Rhodanobacter sp.]|nr:MAG: ABC transporter ATP-binding protein [Rhodanobacter sp.]TAM09937.1 MAG: ABC transporter ATP-binding protein [Rhodanobacter sp.]TAM36724.1 MAG: ABC transporter ATP-binding protein [Rhodanobacter sp.]